MSPQGAVGCFNLSTFRAAFNSFQEHRSTELNRVTSDTHEGRPAASSSAHPFTKLSIPKKNTINKVAMEAATCCKAWYRMVVFHSCGSKGDASSTPRPGDRFKEAHHPWCFEPLHATDLFSASTEDLPDGSGARPVQNNRPRRPGCPRQSPPCTRERPLIEI